MEFYPLPELNLIYDTTVRLFTERKQGYANSRAEDCISHMVLALSSDHNQVSRSKFLSRQNTMGKVPGKANKTHQLRSNSFRLGKGKYYSTVIQVSQLNYHHLEQFWESNCHSGHL